MNELISTVRAVLSVTPARWLALTSVLPLDLLTRRPADGAWSAAECLQHLLDTEQLVFPPRVENFLAGQDFAAFDPDARPQAPGAQSQPAEMAREFARLREGSLQLLDRLSRADLARTARHAELGPVSLEQMLHEWAAHDLNHTIQAEQTLMQPFIAGSGAWRRYFAAHDLERMPG